MSTTTLSTTGKEVQRRISVGSQASSHSRKSSDGNSPNGLLAQRKNSVSFHHVPQPVISGRRPSMAGRKNSIVLAQQFITNARKKSLERMRRRSSVAQNAQNDDKETVLLPLRPRFCATLSTEGQYASLKCYEDVLYQKLSNSYPDYEPILQRCNSPRQSVKLTPRLPLEVDEDFQESENSRIKELPEIENQEMQIVPKCAEVTIKYERGSRPRLRSSDGDRNSLKNAIQNGCNLNKLLMSYRFQIAIDILDSVHVRNGQNVTSQNPTLAKIDPINNFNKWNNSWGKEFEMAYAH